VNAPKKPKSPLLVIFTTVFMDLVGFGIIIPLQGIFGQELGATGWTLTAIGISYPLAQFFFSPLWGQVSDRWGRRPILLMSLTGSTLAYLGFAAAIWMRSLEWLIITRFLQGLFAANISAAQAYIADVTPPEKRAGGMAMIGAAFGIGFILGPAIGGFSLKYLGPLAPGLIAFGICALNLGLAWVRLPESLSVSIQLENRLQRFRNYDPLNIGQLKLAAKHKYLGLLLAMTFLQITAFGSMEQVFALFFRVHLNLGLEDAGAKTAGALVFVGLVSAIIQGGLIRKLAPRFGERRLLLAGLALFCLGMLFMPYGPTYASYFLILLPLAVGRSLIDPSTSTLISRAASASDQGRAFGTFQGLSSLARVVGPLVGLSVFERHHALPFQLAGLLCLVVLIMGLVFWYKTSDLDGIDSRP
jgi:DHA1 family tetracycline resistance protein-like MFS transporter